ncbi:MAG: hypothetical protein KDD60_06215 [Bdellovibrionales bacterium]|nr:hypothetical protein [Bdellovibrionales bacterium]
MILFDLIFSQFLLLVVSVILLNSASAVFHFKKAIHQRMNVIANELFIDGILTQNMRRLDLSRSIIAPVIHTNGSILFHDGSPHSLTLREGTIGASPSSDAITFMEYEANPPISLEWTQGNKLITPNLWQIKSPKQLHAIAYTGDHIFEVQAQLLPFNASQCEVEIHIPGRSLVTDQPPSEAVPRIRILIPLKSIHTIYISRTHTLRFVQHSGESDIENQPLREDFTDLHLKLEYDQRGFFSLLRTAHSNTEEKGMLQVYTHILTRLPFEIAIASSLPSL